MGEIHELFVWVLSLVWFAGATPENDSKMGSGVTFESILGHFGVGMPESLLSRWVTLTLSAFL